jgi:hypothetical protein
MMLSMSREVVRKKIGWVLQFNGDRKKQWKTAAKALVGFPGARRSWSNNKRGMGTGRCYGWL